MSYLGANFKNKKTAIIIGGGRMGQMHYRCLNKLNINVDCIIEKSNKKIKELKNKFKIDNNKIAKKLDFSKLAHHPDLVIIATTADTHFEFAKQAIINKIKYILIEKPVCRSIIECNKLIKLNKNSKSRIAVNHQMQYLEQYNLIKRLVNSKAFGGLKSMNLMAGNCGISMNITHYIEAFRYISDDSPRFINGWFDKKNIKNPRGRKFKDFSGSIRVINNKGSRFYADVSHDQGHGLKVIYNCKIGQIYVDELSGKVILNHREEKYAKLPTTRYGMPSKTSKLKIKPVNIEDSTSKLIIGLINKHKNYANLENGIQAVKVVIGSYLSNQINNKTINFPIDVKSIKSFDWA